MRFRVSAVITATILVFLSVGCATPFHGANVELPVQSGPHPWTKTSFANDPDHFQFAIMADRGGGIRPGVFEDAVKKLNVLQPEFVMCVGDQIEGDATSEAQLDAQWNEFDGIVSRLEMPYFRIPGNHDVGPAGLPGKTKLAKWEQRHGPSYYAFVYRDVLFLCLNSEDPEEGRLSEAQVAFVERALAKHQKVRWTMLFLHKPLWTGEWGKEWPRVRTLLADRPYTVFAGHTHNYMKYTRNGRAYYVLATTGGSSELQGPAEGRVDEVVWVTMTDSGPRIANLLLNGILPEDFRVAPTVPGK